jgi:multidrug efflux pump subunit AcrA (membrane-fusion protein)
MEEFITTDMTVITGDLETTLTLQGSTNFADSQKLTFMNKGKVKTVNVKVGDLVKKGQVLATLTTDDLDDQVEQARITLNDAKQSLQDLLAGYNLTLELLQQQTNYDALLLKQQTIDQDHSLAQVELQQQITSAEQAVADAQKAYDDTKADYEELLSGSNSATADLALSSVIRARNTTFQTAILSLKTIVNDIQSKLDVFDQALILTDKYKYMEKNIYIGAKDQSLRNKAESLFRTISTQLSELDTLYRKLEALPVEQLTNEQILEAYTLVKNIGSELVNR